MERMKFLVIFHIFIFSLFVPSIQGIISTKSDIIYNNIITVDNEGDGDYTSIKQALNNADPWDMIEVYSGTYYERGIKVEKEGITFQGVSHELGNGSDTGKPFINGEGINYVFEIITKNITIDNFHIENADGSAHDIMILTDKSKGCTISNNDLFHSVASIIWAKGSYHKFINNNIGYSVGSYGIGLRYPCKYCIISGNNISHAKDGILLWGSSRHTIIGNRISNCFRYGVDFATGDNTVFESNHVEGNHVGIDVMGAMNVSIKNNNFVDNWQNIFYVTELGWIRKMFKSVKFERNYYDDWIGIGPKPIWGVIWLIPIALVLNIDWHPVRKPYDI